MSYFYTICPQCDARQSYNFDRGFAPATHCPRCGSRVLVNCPHCEEPFRDKGAEFCQKCGKALKSATGGKGE